MRVWPDTVSASELWMTWSIRVVLSRASIHPLSELPTESLVSASYPGTRKTRFIRVDCLALPRQWLSGGDGALDQRRLSIPVCVHPPGPEHGAADPSSTSYTHGSCTTVCGRDTPPSTHTDTPGGSHPSFVRRTLARTRIPAHPSWSPRGGWIRQTSCWILWMDAHWIWPARANTGEKTVRHFTRTSGISVFNPTLIQCRATVYDGGPSLNRRWHRVFPIHIHYQITTLAKILLYLPGLSRVATLPRTHTCGLPRRGNQRIYQLYDRRTFKISPSQYVSFCRTELRGGGRGEEASRWWSIRGWR